jgi:integrase
MAKLSIWLDTRRANEKKEFPIKISISQKTKTAYIGTGISVKKEHYIGETDKVVRSACPNYKSINTAIEAMYAKFLMKIKELEFDGSIHSMSAVQIKDAILNKKQPIITTEKKQNLSFTEYMLGYAKKCKTPKTTETYIFALKKIESFFGKKDVLFSELNYKSLSDMEEYYSSLSASSRSILFRNIRTIFNKAILEEVIPADSYPFKKFKIKSVNKEKDFLPIEYFKKLIQLDVSHSKEKQLAKDMFMLSFYFCGINPIDMFNLTPRGEYIRFEREKTKQHNLGTISIKIQPEAQEIINRYKGEKLLLNFAEKYSGYYTFYYNHRTQIKEIGKMIGFPELTFYYARYSWATYALNYCDVPEYIISKALGHADTTTATKYYIAFDWSKVDNANRKVLDFIKQ